MCRPSSLSFVISVDYIELIYIYIYICIDCIIEMSSQSSRASILDVTASVIIPILLPFLAEKEILTIATSTKMWNYCERYANQLLRVTGKHDMSVSSFPLSYFWSSLHSIYMHPPEKKEARCASSITWLETGTPFSSVTKLVIRDSQVIDSSFFELFYNIFPALRDLVIYNVEFGWKNNNESPSSCTTLKLPPSIEYIINQTTPSTHRSTVGIHG